MSGRDASDRYPYLVVRYMPTVYQHQRIEIAVGPPSVEFIERRCVVQHPAPFESDGSVSASCRALIVPAVQAAVCKLRFRMCIVWAANSCTYCKEHSSFEDTQPPSGGVQFGPVQVNSSYYDPKPLSPRELAEKVTGVGHHNFEKLVAGIECAQSALIGPYVVLVWATHWRGPRRSNDIVGMKSMPDSTAALKEAASAHETIIGCGFAPESDINANRSAPNLNISEVPIISFTCARSPGLGDSDFDYVDTIAIGPFPNGIVGVELVDMFARPAEKFALWNHLCAMCPADAQLRERTEEEIEQARLEVWNARPGGGPINPGGYTAEELAAGFYNPPDPPIDMSDDPNVVSPEEREVSTGLLADYMRRGERPASPELKAKQARLLELLAKIGGSAPREV